MLAATATSGNPSGRFCSTAAEPRDRGIARAVAQRLDGVRPAIVFFAATLVGYVVLAGALVALGLLLTRVLLPVNGAERADEYLPALLADHRAGWLTDASAVGSRIGDVPVLPVLVALTLVVAALVHRLRVGIFLVTAILMEVTLYRVGALAVPRERPGVPRLDDLPVDESFPSGHVAASVVVYLGLALLVTSALRRRWASAALWLLGAVLVGIVAASRIYRGMHHPLDTFAGLLLGLGCLGVALIATRAYGSARRAKERDGREIAPRLEHAT